MDINNISLRPQYLNNSTKWKMNNKIVNKTENINKNNDPWGFYENPHYNSTKEYLEEQQYFVKSQYDDNTFEILDEILQFQKHLLRGDEFKKIYFKKDNITYNYNRKYIQNKYIEIDESVLPEDNNELELNDDNDSVYAEDFEYFSDIENELQE